MGRFVASKMSFRGLQQLDERFTEFWQAESQRSYSSLDLLASGEPSIGLSTASYPGS